MCEEIVIHFACICIYFQSYIIDTFYTIIKMEWFAMTYARRERISKLHDVHDHAVLFNRVNYVFLFVPQKVFRVGASYEQVLCLIAGL